MFKQIQWPTKVENYKVMIYKCQKTEKAIIDRWLERTCSAFEAPVTNIAPRSQSLARFYIHFLIALGHLISKTYRGNGFPSLLLRILSSSLLCTQHFVLIAWTYSIVSASTTNRSNIAVQGETHLMRGWGIHNLRNSLMPLIPEGKIFVSWKQVK